jgi:hypothetical protein
MVDGADAMSKTSNTGLAAFTRKTPPLGEASSTPIEAAATVRQRGKGEVVALTVRLPRADWERLHQLAVAEGTSIQQLAVLGLSRIFADKGLPGLKS